MHEVYLHYDNVWGIISQIWEAERVTCDNSIQRHFRAREIHFHLSLAVLFTTFHGDREFAAAAFQDLNQFPCCLTISAMGNNIDFNSQLTKNWIKTTLKVTVVIGHCLGFK